MARLRDAGRFTALRARQAGRLVRDVLVRNRPAEIAAYRGYGSPTRAYLHGRALAKPAYSTAAVSDPPWRNLLNTYRRARSDPIAYAQLRIQFGSASQVVTADDEGFFSEWLDVSAADPSEAGWRDGSVELLSPVVASRAVTARAQVLIPPADAAFGVISDLDDTVIQSHVTSFLRAARTSFTIRYTWRSVRLNLLQILRVSEGSPVKLASTSISLRVTETNLPRGM